MLGLLTMATEPLFSRGLEWEPGEGLGRQRKEGREQKVGRKVTSGFLHRRSTISPGSCTEMAGGSADAEQWQVSEEDPSW